MADETQSTQQTQPNLSPMQDQSQTKIKVHKKSFILIVFVVVIIFILLLIALPSSPLHKIGSPSNQAQNGDTLIATVGDQKIYKSTVQAAAEEQYSKNDITKEVLNKFLPLVLERAVLDFQARQMHIVISDEDIQTITKGNNSIAAINNAKYSILQEKVTEANVKVIDAFSVSYWVPSFADPQKPEYSQMRKDNDAAIPQIEAKMKAGVQPVDIAKEMYSKYPSIQGLLAVNGYRFAKTSETSLFTKPESIIMDDTKRTSQSVDTEVYDALLKMKPGEIKAINRSDGSGGIVYHVISVNLSGANSYEEYIKQKENELVIYETTQVAL